MSYVTKCLTNRKDNVWLAYLACVSHRLAIPWLLCEILVSFTQPLTSDDISGPKGKNLNTPFLACLFIGKVQAV